MMSVKKIYVLNDLQCGVIIGNEGYINEYSARHALVTWLLDQYWPEDWFRLAKDNNFDDPIEFIEAVLNSSQFDESLDVEIKEMKIV